VTKNWEKNVVLFGYGLKRKSSNPKGGKKGKRQNLKKQNKRIEKKANSPTGREFPVTRGGERSLAREKEGGRGNGPMGWEGRLRPLGPKREVKTF